MELNSPRFGNLSWKTLSPNFLFGLLFLSFLFYIQSGLQIHHPSESRPQIRPSYLQHKFAFSHRELFGDAYFMRALQDVGYCRTKSITDSNGKLITDPKLITQNCEDKSWLFSIFDLATDLHPEYRLSFKIGALALSVLISDLQGASLLLDKARLFYPRDKALLMISAYHELYETKNKIKAAQLMVEAARNGAPQWYFSLAGRIYEDQGQKAMTNEVIKEMQTSGVPGQFIERLKSKIETSRK